MDKKKRNKYILPPGTDDAIRRVYQEKVGIQSCAKGYSPVKDLAQRLGVPRWKISRRATHLGVHIKHKKEPVWSEHELNILKRLAHFLPETIQKELKLYGYSRTLIAIVIKRKRMRLMCNLKGQSAYSLSQCFGVDEKMIYRWIKNKLLQAQLRETNRTQNTYYIKDKWIRTFIIDSVNIIDFRKIDKYWLVDILTKKGA